MPFIANIPFREGMVPTTTFLDSRLLSAGCSKSGTAGMPGSEAPDLITRHSRRKVSALLSVQYPWLVTYTSS